MPDVRQAVILAGGRGTRLGALTQNLPKPMVPMNGRPFIAYVVEMLRDAGIEEILFLLGYLPEPIVDYFGDGSQFGLSIGYSVSSPDDETGTRLRKVRDRVHPRFLLAYCDNYWPVALGDLNAVFARHAWSAMLTVYRNRDGYTRDNVRVADARIVVYDKTRQLGDLAGVDIGYGIFDRSVLDRIPAGNPSFEASVYPQLVAAGTLGAYESDHRYYSVGSRERLAMTEKFLQREKTVLVDRDGTLNASMPKAHYVTAWSQWRWLPGVLEALAALTSRGYRIVVVTNQPGVARGLLTHDVLADIHARMIAQAADVGARIDAVLACTHGWDDGCDCRKPRPGLLIQAQRRFALDLHRTPFIGDEDRDAQAAQSVGAPFWRVDTARPLAAAVAELLEGERSFASAS